MMYGYYDNYGWGPGMMSGYGGGAFGGVMMLAFWVLAVIFLVWVIREVRGKHMHSSSALNILKERYAKGEINKDEFEAKKKDLA